MRAYAKFLQLDSSSLTAIFKRKRSLPTTKAKSVASRLKLAPCDAEKFVMSVRQSKANLMKLAGIAATEDAETLQEQHHFQIIAEWEHYAVLTLMKVKDFESDSAWIAKRLGIPQIRAQNVLDRLISTGLVVCNESPAEFKPSSARFNTSEDVLSASLQKCHKEALEMGVQKLESVGVLDRDYSCETIAVDRERLPEAKAMIREFRRKMGALLAGENPREVYHLCLQLYPVTQIESGTEE
jgi:uncharacterized protein (TIGR02147 family)